MSKHLTSKENIALDLIFHCVGESRFNRTPEEYAAISAKLPPLKVLHGYINDFLGKCADAGYVPFEISRKPPEKGRFRETRFFVP